MFAVVAIGGKQYKVSPGDTLDVDRLTGKAGEQVEFDEVFLTSDGKKVSVGAPKVTGVKVKAKIIAQEQGEKIEVRRYKSKVRYRRHRGFRPQLTKLEILSIGRS